MPWEATLTENLESEIFLKNSVMFLLWLKEFSILEKFLADFHTHLLLIPKAGPILGGKVFMALWESEQLQTLQNKKSLLVRNRYKPSKTFKFKT
jgi:hypothetical protein